MTGKVLQSGDITTALKSKQLVTGYIDLLVQLQPTGFELTVHEVSEFVGRGAIGFSNSRRKLAPTKPIVLHDKTATKLLPGSYLVRYNETVRLPLDIMAIVFPRSSLMRNGAMLYTAVWDPGYHGRGQGLLQVNNRRGLSIYNNARIGQLVFLQLKSEVRHSYSGAFQGEGL